MAQKNEATPAAEAELAPMRKAIDGIDGALVELFARRFDEVKKVTEVKHRLGLPAAIPARIEVVIGRVRATAEKAGFPADTAEKIWRLLMQEMIAYEESHLRR